MWRLTYVGGAWYLYGTHEKAASSTVRVSHRKKVAGQTTSSLLQRKTTKVHRRGRRFYSDTATSTDGRIYRLLQDKAVGLSALAECRLRAEGTAVRVSRQETQSLDAGTGTRTAFCRLQVQTEHNCKFTFLNLKISRRDAHCCLGIPFIDTSSGMIGFIMVSKRIELCAVVLSASEKMNKQEERGEDAK